MQKLALAVALSGVLGLFAGVRADATTLQDLISAGSSTPSGNVIYSDFAETGNLPASDITVNITATGIQFTGNWNTLTPGSDSSIISYTLTAVPGTQISQADLFFAGQVIVSHATATVSEKLSDLTNAKDYTMTVFYDGQGSPNDDLRDSIVIDPTVSSLRITKAINVQAADHTSFASLNLVENAYTEVITSGSQPPAPEPATAGMLALGAAGLLFRRSRRAVL